jgi:hypothetical protein
MKTLFGGKYCDRYIVVKGRYCDRPATVNNLGNFRCNEHDPLRVTFVGEKGNHDDNTRSRATDVITSLLEALRAYRFMEQTKGGLNPHPPGTNAHKAFDLGQAAVTKATTYLEVCNVRPN